MFHTISSSLSPWDAICAFAGGALPHTILSCCQTPLLSMFDTRTVLPLRATCRDATLAVAAHPWDDAHTVIHGNIGPALLPADPGAQAGAWRACFPRARAANVSERYAEENPRGRRWPVLDGDFAHLAGLRALNMSHCSAVTDAAFAHLQGLRALCMRGCRQAALTDAAFAPLAGIQSLDMSHCIQATITDAALVPLAGIHALNLSGCVQPGLTPAGLRALAGPRLRALELQGSLQGYPPSVVLDTVEALPLRCAGVLAWGLTELRCALGGWGALPAAADACLAARAPQRIVAALRAHNLRREPQLCELALRALAALLSAGAAAAQEACCAAGAVPLAVAVLNAHAQGAREPCAAANALLFMLWDVEACVGGGAALALAQAGLRPGRQNEPLATQVLTTLARLTQGTQGSEAGRQGCRAVVPAVCQAVLGAHPALREQACSLLISISAVCGEGKAACMQALPWLAPLLQGGSRGVAGKAAWVIWNVTSREELLGAFLASGVLPALAGALDAHPGDALVARAVCGVFRNVCAGHGVPSTWSEQPLRDARVAACMALGAPARAMRVLSAFAHDADACCLAAGALVNCAWTSPANGAGLVEAGAVPLLVAAFALHAHPVEQHPGVGSLVRKDAALALDTLGFREDGAPKAL